jgi:lipopolysaccharide/colanic/teichoic acid biosynthesis glycosyltransferase
MVLIIVTLPVLLLAMFSIVLTSGGPVLFRQERVGYQGREFVIFKLRTMRSGKAPKASGNRIFNKVEGDARVTPVGRLLRKFSLDELPQLFNVLRGEMSLVGPRPLLPSDMHRFPLGRPMRRFDVKPGLTGLWQVSGRSLLSDAERIRLDLEYVERWSPWMDMMILLRTPLAVLLTRGAF